MWFSAVHQNLTWRQSCHVPGDTRVTRVQPGLLPELLRASFGGSDEEHLLCLISYTPVMLFLCRIALERRRDLPGFTPKLGFEHPAPLLGSEGQKSCPAQHKGQSLWVTAGKGTHDAVHGRLCFAPSPPHGSGGGQG